MCIRDSYTSLSKIGIGFFQSCFTNQGDFTFVSYFQAMSPAALFQRIFNFISGISISDYVRKRRLTLAGYDLKNTDISVLDAAVKYGFQSHSSFSRAFKEHHGITPSQARLKNARLNDYLPINFSDMRFVGGKRIMAERKRIMYKETPERLMVGLPRETSFSDAGVVWQEFFQGDTIERCV